MKKDITEISFPNGWVFSLYPERQTIKKYGLDFPSEIEERTLFITGISGSGKTSLAKHICENEHIEYGGQAFILLNEKPKVMRCEKSNFYRKSFEDFSEFKVVDGHFVFNLPPLKKKHVHAHEKEVCNADYEALKIIDNFLFERKLKKKFIFEFRQLIPSLIQEARKKREEQESVEQTQIRYRHTFRQHTEDEIRKGEYLLYQTAHKLFEKGLDVYIRTDFNGVPLRFLR